MLLTSFVARLGRLMTDAAFRARPLQHLYRRIRWHAHWGLRPKKPFTVTLFDNLHLRLGPSTASYGIYLNGGFSDPDLARLFIEHLRPGMVVLDGGAHIGEYSVLFAALVGPQGHVHAFEPDPRVFGFLIENVRENALQAQVTCNPLALGEAKEKALLVLEEDPTASALEAFAGAQGRGGAIPVSVTTLDAYTKDHGLTRVDVLKFDVEGAEVAALHGARRLLRQCRPGLVFVECHGRDRAREVREALEATGYHVASYNEEATNPHLIARPNIHSASKAR